MNGQLSFQSSAICHDAATSSLASAAMLRLNRAGAKTTSRVTDMATHKVVNKKLMLLMAMCLVFATAVPVIVLAAG